MPAATHAKRRVVLGLVAQPRLHPYDELIERFASAVSVELLCSILRFQRVVVGGQPPNTIHVCLCAAELAVSPHILHGSSYLVFPLGSPLLEHHLEAQWHKLREKYLVLDFREVPLELGMMFLVVGPLDVLRIVAQALANGSPYVLSAFDVLTGALVATLWQHNVAGIPCRHCRVRHDHIGIHPEPIDLRVRADHWLVSESPTGGRVLCAPVIRAIFCQKLAATLFERDFRPSARRGAGITTTASRTRRWRCGIGIRAGCNCCG
mmetsp:Transcript_3139/g.6301  ORF Transcript_3139/g.6301 Transcript_3139/m.6301 type:complete len:264 (-) Transcript_3139:383-1174(-)